MTADLGPDRSEAIAPRIIPEAALRPGAVDARTLLVVWFVRKSSYWLLFSGLIGLSISRHSQDTKVDWTDPDGVLAELLSPGAGIVLSVLARLGAAIAGLALAYPLARAYEVGLSPRTSFGSSIGKAFDRLNLARAYRSLRWTHHVRQEAIGRLGPTASKRVGRLDPIMDIANISLGVLAFVVVPIVLNV
jgi:hypothetical protein